MRNAFTLIELMVVLLVMSIVAGAVTLSLAGPKRRAGLDDVVANVVQFDLLTRQRGLRSGRAMQMVFDLEGGRLLRLGGGEAAQEALGGYVLPAGTRVARLFLAGHTVAFGRTAIWCSERGYTPTYALEIVGPAGRRRLLFAGLTGQVTELNDEADIREAMSLLSSEGADAD